MITGLVKSRVTSDVLCDCHLIGSNERWQSASVTMPADLYAAWRSMLPSFFLITLGVLVLAHLPCSSATCNTEFTEIFVNKEKPYEYNGRPTRLTCYRKITIRKCEGTCTSEVSPSVVRFPGFKKVHFSLIIQKIPATKKMV